MLNETCCENLGILRPFDDGIFKRKPDEKLFEFDKYIEEMDEATIINGLTNEEIEK